MDSAYPDQNMVAYEVYGWQDTSAQDTVSVKSKPQLDYEYMVYWWLTYDRDFPRKTIGGAIAARMQNPMWICCGIRYQQDRILDLKVEPASSIMRNLPSKTGKTIQTWKQFLSCIIEQQLINSVTFGFREISACLYKYGYQQISCVSYVFPKEN